MKKILVIGASGSIGLLVIKYLLSEGKYDITALDLKNKKVHKRLHKYNKRINIIYGDIVDRNLIENLVKDTDIIINLASALPPLSDYKYGLANAIEYAGCEHIIRAVSYYNPKCYLIYASSTSLYNKIAKVDSKITLKEDDYFNIAKQNAENLITKKMKNFTILRVPLVLSDLTKDNFIYNVNKNDIVETITKEDAAYAFVSCIDNYNKVNGKTLNIGGGESCRTKYSNLLYNIIKYHGISWNFILSSLFLTKNYTSFVLEDSNQSQKLLKYQSDSLQSYYMRQKRRSKKRKISKAFGKLYLLIKKPKENK